MKKFLILMMFSIAFLEAFAQRITVKGRVTDNSGAGLPGVSILVQGTRIGATSDASGQYTIAVQDANATLVFSFVGFTGKKIRLNGQTVLNVSLTEDSNSMDEVVVVGYGTQKKASVVGAISNVNIKDLRRAAPSNLSNALGGSVPGLITRMGDGAVGGVQNRYSNGGIDDAQIFIRGKSTLNAQGALVLIDGVEGSLSRINPEDIEQFTILKDASATAIYGVRGANGVILITTRRGEIGKPKISVTSQFRRMQPMDFPKFLGSYDYATLYNEAQRNADPTLPVLYSDQDLELYRTGTDPYGHSDVDWKDLLTKDYFLEHQHVANISGGTERVRYYIGGEYNQSGGIFVGDKSNNTDYNYRRYNLRSNLDFDITKSTLLSVKLNGRLNDLNTPIKPESSGQRVNGVAWSDIVVKRPNEGQPYNPNGTYNSGNGIAGWNALSELYDGGFIRRLSNTIESNFTLNQKLDFIIPGLGFRALYGMTFSNGSTRQLNRNPSLFNYNTNTEVYTLQTAEVLPWYSAVGGQFQDFGRTQQVEAALNYDKVIAENHHITAMGVFTQSTNEIQALLPRYFQGVAGRITYAYKNKYLAESNLGYNGSDAFNKDNRFAFFPAGALGWVISEENFMKKHVKFIDFMKIRASYGEVGNDRISGTLQYLYQYNFAAPTAPATNNTVNGYYNLGTGAGTAQIGLTEGTLGNDMVTWEKARKTDLGIELKVLNNRLSFTGDVFYEERNDILSQRSDFPIYTGLTTSKLPALNMARVNNKGMELSLSYVDKVGSVGFNIGGNFTFVRNKVVFKGEAKQKYYWMYSTGHPIGTESLYTWTGKFYSEEDLQNPEVAKPVGVKAGELMFADLNGDKVINSDDMAYQGFTETPEKTFGFSFGADYKGFYLSTNWYGASNVAYRPSGAIRNEFANNVQPFQKEDRWVYDPARGLDTRATAKYPLLMIGGASQTRLPSTFHKLNAEFLRLRAVELGYDFPKTLTQKLRVSALRLFLSGSNLLTFSGMKKYRIDPEYIGSSNPDAIGTNGASTGVYSPQNKFYAFGLNVTF